MLHYTKHLTRLVIRAFAFLLILAALALGTGALIVKLMFTPEHLGAVLTDQLQQLFQRPVQMESVSVTPFSGIRITGLKVLDAPDLPGRNLISGGVFTAHYRLLPLFRRKLSLTDLNLESPVIALVRRQDGTWNFSDIAHNYRLRRKQQAGPALSLGVDEARISDGTVTYIDLQRNIQHAFYGVNLNFSDFAYEGDFPVTLSFLSKNRMRGSVVEGRVNAEGVLNLAGFALQNAGISGLKVEAEISGRPLSASGEIRNLINPEVSAVVELAPVTTRDILPFIPFPAGVSIPSSHWNITAAFPFPGRVELRSAEGRIGNLSWRGRGDFDFSASTPAYRLWMQAGPFQLSEVSGWWSKAGSLALGGKAQVKLSMDKTERGTGISRAFVVLDKARGSFNGLKISDADLAFSARDDFRNMTLKSSNVTVQSGVNKITDIRMSAAFLKDVLEIEKLSARLNGSPFKLTAKAESLLSKSRKIEVTAHFAKLDLVKDRALFYSLASGMRKKAFSASATAGSAPSRLKWLRDFRSSLPDEIPVSRGWIGVDKFEHVNFAGSNLKIGWSLKGLSSGMKKLGGRISISAGPGIIYQVQNLAEKEKFYRIAFMPFLSMYRMDRMGVMKIGARFKDMDFNNIGGDYDFESGRMKINNFYVDGSTISAASEGAINWVGESMRVKVYTVFKSESALGGLPESLTDASGRPALAFSLDGPMEKPTVNMLSPKKNGTIIEDALKKGIRADFKTLDKFIKGS